MAVTITDQRTVVSQCDATTGWTGTSAPAVFTTQPSGIETTGCLGMQVSNATHHAYFTGTAVNFTANPSLIYVWVFHRAELDTVVNGGITIVLGDGTNRVGYHVGGSDQSSFRHDSGPVGWQCFVLDTANRPAALTAYAGSAGSLNSASITQIGVGFKTLVKSVGGVENCFWDVIRRGTVGQGIQISGGTVGAPGKWSEIAALDRSTGNLQAYGIVRELGAGVYGVQGPLTFGHATANTYFDDTDVTVVFENRLVTADKYSITLLGGSGTTVLKLTNSTIQAPLTGTAALAASSTTFTTLNLVNTQLVRFKQSVAFSAGTNGASHTLTGCTFKNCAQVALGRVVTRDTLFQSYATASLASLAWNANINIQTCQFTGNTRGINHPTAGTFTYTGLTFATNTYDIANTSGGAVIISAAAGSNPSTSINDAGGSVTINNVKNFTINNIQPSSELRIYNAANTTIEYAGIETVSGGLTSFSIFAGGTGYSIGNVLTLSGGTFATAAQIIVTAVSGGVITAASIQTVGSYTVSPDNPVTLTGGGGTGAKILATIRGSFTYSFNYAGDIPVTVIAFHLKYKDLRLTGQTLKSTDQTIPIQQIVDRVYYNP